ncbi:MAG: TraB/GumN family protein [Brevundimonas sp.]
MTFINRIRHAGSLAARLAAGTALGVGLFAAVAGTPGFALAQDAAPSPGPAMWVVSDADSTIYLFGTVHLLKPETQWRTPELDAALAQATELWLEVPNVDDQAAAMPLVQQYGLNIGGAPISSLLTAEENAQLQAAAAAIGVPPQAMEVMQPWLVGLQVSVAAAVRAGYDPASGVDTRLKAAADESGTAVRGFETLEQQFRFFHDLPQEVQLQFLRQSLATWEEAEAMLDGMVELWAAGDVEGFDALVVDEMQAEWGQLYDVLLVDRNVDWAGQIQTMLDGSGTTFIAVGAAHLVGDDSVQSVLEERGVTVTRR